MRSALLVMLVAPLFACDEEVKEPNEPGFVGRPLVECRKIEGVVKLSRVEFTVRDLDGVEDLVEPWVTVEATRLTMNEEPRATAEDCTADDEKCDARYTWAWSRDSEQLLCRETGDKLTVTIEVHDLDRHILRGSQKSSLDE